jgi:hypothetical protein
MNYTIMSLAHICLIYPIGHVYTEPELEVLIEQVQVEDLTNLDLNQGKPQCIKPMPLFFNLNLCFMLCLIVH